MPRLTKPVDEDCVEFLFDKDIEPDGFYLAVGRRRSGKTSFFTRAASHLPSAKTSQIICILGAEGILEQWSQITHPFYIHIIDPKNPQSGVEVLQDIIEEQNRRVKFCRQHRLAFPPQWAVTLYIDDCGTLEEFMHSKQLKWISSNGRQVLSFFKNTKIRVACCSS